MQESRGGYGFSDNILEAALTEANGICESCKEPFDHLAVHHILPIAVAKARFRDLPPYVIGSIHNAMCVCELCHRREDELALMEEQIQYIAPKLIALQNLIALDLKYY